MDYQDVVNALVEGGHVVPQLGELTVLFWNHANHFAEWQSREVNSSEPIRTLVMPVPLELVPPDRDIANLAMVAIAFSQHPDYDDLSLQFYIVQ